MAPIFTPDPPSDKKSAVGNFVFRVAMLDAEDVAGGGTEQTVGFQVTQVNGSEIDTEVLLEFAVFQDEYLTVPAVNAVLSDAVTDKGTILAGSGTAALKVQTNETGEFQCKLTDAVDEPVYLACSTTFGSPAVSCRETDSVTFSA